MDIVPTVITPINPVIDETTNNEPPQIPPELIQTIPSDLIIKKPLPSIIIQSSNSLTIVPTQQLQPINQPPNQTATSPITLESLLIKRDSESDEYFRMRSAYSKAALSVFGGKINPATAILLGQMATDKAMYGVVYPDESDRVIRYINSQLLQ